MAGKAGMRHYPVALKQRAVELALQHTHAFAEIVAQLELREVQWLKRWVRAFRRNGPAGLCKAQGRPRRQPQTDLARLQMENALIKKMAFRIASPYAREAQYRVIEHYRGQFAVNAMCAFFGLSRAAYYAWRWCKRSTSVPSHLRLSARDAGPPTERPPRES